MPFTTCISISERDKAFLKEKNIKLSWFIAKKIEEWRDHLENPQSEEFKRIELENKMLKANKLLSAHSQFLYSKNLMDEFENMKTDLQIDYFKKRGAK